MAINLKRLRDFASGSGAPGIPQSMPNPEMAMETFEPFNPIDVSLDDPNNLAPEAMIHRLKEPQVSYMEIEGGWGDAGCEGCRFLMGGNFCVKASVMSYVSDKGCCNFFEPRDVSMVAPEYWEAIENMKDAEVGNVEISDDAEDIDVEPEDEEEDEEEADED